MTLSTITGKSGFTVSARKWRKIIKAMRSHVHVEQHFLDLDMVVLTEPNGDTFNVDLRGDDQDLPRLRMLQKIYKERFSDW